MDARALAFVVSRSLKPSGFNTRLRPAKRVYARCIRLTLFSQKLPNAILANFIQNQAEGGNRRVTCLSDN